MVQNNAGADGPGVGGRDAAADRRPAPDRTLQPVDGGEDQRAGDGGVEQREVMNLIQKIMEEDEFFRKD